MRASEDVVVFVTTLPTGNWLGVHNMLPEFNDEMGYYIYNTNCPC